MLDFSHIPDGDVLGTAIFKSTSDNNGSDASTEWQTWQKPKGAKFIFMWALGGGGAGGNGATVASGSTKGGGSGGASSAMSKLFIPAFLLPDILFVQVGIGGRKSGVGNFDQGLRSWISTKPSILGSDVVLQSGAGVAQGVSGTNIAAGTPAGGGGVATVANSIYSILGNWSTLGGIPSGAGGNISGATGASKIALTSTITSGGAGGGSSSAADVDFAGGDITGNGGYIPTLSGGGANQKGSDGLTLWKPFCSTGGAGGGSGGSGTLVGGNGGNGGIGSGGGGGGGGITGGIGGNGGDGIVFIICI